MAQLSMGVINITPNSFSDGSLFNSQDLFSKKFNQIKKWASIIDIGAESTAPFNKPIDSILELERFERVLFPFVTKTPDPQITISIDTYKPEVFYEVYIVLKKYWPKTKIVFNDISGCLDEELLMILKDESLDFDYVLCHNLSPVREKSSHHMDFVDEESTFYENILSFFYERLSLLKDIKRKIIIDPCLGFSKTREQNHSFLRKMDDFLSCFSSYDVLLGLSRKSFLRFPASMDLRQKENLNELECIQSIIIYNLLSKNKNSSLIFRMHDDIALKSALNMISILE